MNPVLQSLSFDLINWFGVFGATSTFVILVVFSILLLTQGYSGLREAVLGLLKGWPRIIGGVVGALLLAGGEGLAGWYVLPSVVSSIADSFGKIPTAGLTTACQYLGALIGGLIGATSGLVVGAAVVDALHASPRRVLAITGLVFKEAVRRKALLVFVVFGLLFLFATWFVTDTNERPDLQVKVHVSFVLTVLTWLVLPVVLLLSCWGLPEDIRARSLHTVVTKPTRRNEIVLGRILGFVTVGTLVLMVMSVFGSIWIRRQVPESAQSQLTCRVPVFGGLKFRDRQGEKVEKGLNVGDVWEFRGYIEGGTRARAVWTLAGVTPDLMVEVDSGGKENATRLMIETRFQAFRTYKGNMNRSLLCQLILSDPEEKIRVPLKPFEVKEFGNNVTLVDRKLSYFDEVSKSQKAYDLFDDLAKNGDLIIEARCIDPGQFLGMAQPDLFIRTPDKSFEAGYFKAVGGIWLMMTLVIVLSVTASCFVKGPVATLLVFSLLIIGSFFQNFLLQIATGQVKNMGTFESVHRIYEHMNPMTELPDSRGARVLKAVDKVPQAGLWVVAHIIPSFTRFRMAEYVANGFDVPILAPVPPNESALLPATLTLVAFILPCLLLGYFSLKARELESK